MAKKTSHHDFIRLMYESSDNGKLFFDKKKCEGAILYAPSSCKEVEPVFVVNESMKFFPSKNEKAVMLIQSGEQIIFLAVTDGKLASYRYISTSVPTWVLD